MANEPLLQQVTQNPLLISTSSEKLFQDSIAHVVGHEHASAFLNASMATETDDDFWPTAESDWRHAYRPYVVKDGVLQIPVMGVLLNRFPYALGRWATGYTYIRRALRRGLEDGNVRAIALVIDSPGGEVAGCFECVDEISEARGRKPMRSFLSDHGYSAAFAISTGPDTTVVTRSGGAGSVGVVTAHYDMSEAVEKYGLKVTFIYAGKHKVDGNPYEKLPAAVKDRIQKRIDRIYGVFVATVARNRSMEEEAVRATEALTYDAEDAIEVGFADRMGSLEDEMVAFAGETAEAKDEQMANQNEPKTVDQATHDTAVTSARTEGMTAEKTRIKAILASDEGKKRPKAAMSCAMNTNMSLDDAKAFLGDLPEEKAEAKTETETTTAKVEEEDPKKAKGPKASGKTPFEQSMEKSGNPNVGDGGEGDDEDEGDDDDKASASILSAYAGIRGGKPKKRAA